MKERKKLPALPVRIPENKRSDRFEWKEGEFEIEKPAKRTVKQRKKKP